MSDKLYLNSLAPWEEKNQYHSIVKLGSNINNQIQIIQNAANKNLVNQLEVTAKHTNQIIVSQETTQKILHNGFDDLTYKLNEVSVGINELKSAFFWGISDVVWQIEQTNETLRGILSILSAPLDTQAIELRIRAEEAYQNGWYEDAIIDFLESEIKNRYDFSVHISLGILYLFHKIDKSKALEYFEKAIKYARPKSNYYTSYALLHKGLILIDFNRIEEAEEATREAIKLTPYFVEAYYQNAQYNSILKNSEISVKNLEICIKSDIKYLLKSYNDPFFDNIRSNLDELYNRILIAKKTEFNILEAKVINHINKLKNTFNLFEELNLISDREIIIKTIKQIENKLGYLNKISKTNFIIDNIYTINKEIPYIYNEIELLITSIENNINKKIESINLEKNDLKYKIDSIKNKIEKDKKIVSEKTENKTNKILGLSSIIILLGLIYLLYIFPLYFHFNDPTQIGDTFGRVVLFVPFLNLIGIVAYLIDSETFLISFINNSIYIISVLTFLTIFKIYFKRKLKNNIKTIEKNISKISPIENMIITLNNKIEKLKKLNSLLRDIMKL